MTGERLPCDIVDRPTRWRRTNSIYPLDAIVATAETGKAIRIPLGGRAYAGMQSTLHRMIRRRGYRLHTAKAGDAFLCWVDGPTDAPVIGTTPSPETPGASA